jgi:hypothetical protein
MNGTNQEVIINSDPAGAKIIIDNRLYEKSPVVIEVTRNKDIAGRLKKDGYEEESFIIERNISKWTYLDILFPPAFLFDLYTGGAYVFEKDRYYVEMGIKKEREQPEVKYNDIRSISSKRSRYHPLFYIPKKWSDPNHKTVSQEVWDAKRKKHEDAMKETARLQKLVKELLEESEKEKHRYN